MLRALAVVLVLATVVASCTREREEVVAPDALTAENAFHGSFSNHFVTTVSEFDSVMDVAASGDTITLQASTTFDLSDSTYHKTNFSLNFVGQSPRPTIECNSGSDHLFKFVDTVTGGNGVEVVTFDNIDFESNYDEGSAVVYVLNGHTASVKNCDFDLQGETILLGADYVTVKNCDISHNEGSSTPLLVYSRGAQTFDHLFKDCTISRGEGTSRAVYMDYSSAGGDVDFHNVDFTYVDTGAGDALEFKVYKNGTAATVNIDLADCDFTDRHVKIADNSLGDDVIANITYTRNSSDIAGPCWQDIQTDLFTLLNGVITVNYTFEAPWTYDGTLMPANLGEVASGTNYSVVRCNNTNYLVAAFSLVADDDYGECLNPVVKYDNEDEDPLTNYATVYWNSSLGKWNAEMDLTNVSSPIDWQCTATFADSTKSGTVIESVTYSTRNPGPCTIQEFMGGGGGSEEEEE